MIEAVPWPFVRVVEINGIVVDCLVLPRAIAVMTAHAATQSRRGRGVCIRKDDSPLMTPAPVVDGQTSSAGYDRAEVKNLP